ncbi:MerR family DNA-binding transcriptional regulator [Temperatibacter marinus]|uniref:MerR family DNA-binding transcriptional regulator n=1 Tax=Temperatibacter marinus TaxID=1456591 RepID=A0AA52EEE4_9PROT|nr:MerR family DNA-binding transcriptional regulator [Temperatibacter marinus]WND03947.1 MerR family DNA-binding transcriptional regulator [Temperatibacter marinus]
MIMQDSKERFTIKDLTKEFDVTSRTLRHYEEQGLITPTREGQNRIYSPADRTKVAWILRGRRVGFSLSEISEMLDLYSLDDDRTTQRIVTLEKCRSRINALEDQRQDIDDTIKELTDFCSLLEDLTACEKTGKWISKATGKTPEVPPAVKFLKN